MHWRPIRAVARRVRELGGRRVTLLPFNPATSGKYSWVRRPAPLPGAVRQNPEHLAMLRKAVDEEGLEVVPA